MINPAFCSRRSSSFCSSFQKPVTFLACAIVVLSLPYNDAKPTGQRRNGQAFPSANYSSSAVSEVTRIIQEHRMRSSERKDELCRSATDSCSSPANSLLCSSSIDITTCATKPSTSGVCQHLTLDLGETALRHTCFASLWIPLSKTGLLASTVRDSSENVRPPAFFTLKLGNAGYQTFILPQLQASQTTGGGSYWAQLDVADLVEHALRNSSRLVKVLACTSSSQLLSGEATPGKLEHVHVHSKELRRTNLIHLKANAKWNPSPLFILGTLGPDPLDRVDEFEAQSAGRVRRDVILNFLNLDRNARSLPVSSESQSPTEDTGTVTDNSDTTTKRPQIHKGAQRASPCAVQPLRLSLRKDLGIKAFFPKKFSANDCYGRCSKKRAEKYSSYHARLKALLRIRGRAAGKLESGSCCVPTKFESLSVIMKKRANADVHIVWLKDVIVKECACT